MSRSLDQFEADSLEDWRQMPQTRALLAAAADRRASIVAELCRQAASGPKRVIRIIAGRLEEADWLEKKLKTKGSGET